MTGTEPHSYLNSNNTLIINLTFESLGGNIAVTTTALSNEDNATGAPILVNNAVATGTVFSAVAATIADTNTFFIPGTSFTLALTNPTPIDPTAFVSSAAFTLLSGAPVPVSFGSADNPDRQRITPLTLNSTLISFSDSSTPPADDFTLQFTADIAGNPDFDVPEEGSAIYTDITDGATSVDYEFTTDEDTSTSTLVLSTTGTPRAELGTITLNFTAITTSNSDGGGTYISGGTGNTGSFVISLGAP